MLAQPAPFPFAGCDAFLRGTAARATVIRHNADGTATVKLHPPRFMSADQRIDWQKRGASLTTSVPLGDLYQTERDAVWCGKPPKGRARVPRVRQ